MFHHDRAHTGRSEFSTSANPGILKWTFAIGGSVAADPVIGVDGTIYVGSQDYKFFAVRPDGTRKWASATRGTVEPAAAIGADGTVYVGANDQNLPR